MPRARGTHHQPARRRLRRADDLPSLPVAVDDGTARTGVTPPTEPQPTTEADAVEDTIRRMVEAAYT